MSITTQVFILFIVVLIGILARKLRYFTDETIRGVTQLVVNITVPCLTISNMQRPFAMDVLVNFLITMVLSAIVVFASLGVGLLLFKNRPHDRRAVLANLLGFSNCGFMGYPIILAIDPDWMIYAVAYNIAFTVIVWTVGVSLYQGKENASIKRALLNPNIVSAVIGIALFCLNVTLPSVPAQVLSMIGGLTTPLTMLLIGTRVYGIRISDLKDPDYHLASVFRLFVLPLAVYLALKPFGFAPQVASTIFILTAMPCGTLTAMQAELYGGDTVFASRAIAYSTLLSLLSVPIMSMLL